MAFADDGGLLDGYKELYLDNPSENSCKLTDDETGVLPDITKFDTADTYAYLVKVTNKNDDTSVYYGYNAGLTSDTTYESCSDTVKFNLPEIL